jgi:hypothetical protein
MKTCVCVVADHPSTIMTMTCCASVLQQAKPAEGLRMHGKLRDVRRRIADRAPDNLQDQIQAMSSTQCYAGALFGQQRYAEVQQIIGAELEHASRTIARFEADGSPAALQAVVTLTAMQGALNGYKAATEGILAAQASQSRRVNNTAER